MDKTVKIQKLHCYAEKYGKDNGLPVKEIKNLKQFFVNCLEKGKLLKDQSLFLTDSLGLLFDYFKAKRYTKSVKFLILLAFVSNFPHLEQ